MLLNRISAFAICLASTTACLAATDPVEGSFGKGPATGTNAPAASTRPALKDAKTYEAQMQGVTLVADVTLKKIDQFRTLGMRGGFGQDQPLCDFIATEKWISKFGASIAKGDSIKIGKVTLIEATDGFGNTGTKLILDSAAPKEGLVFYCYAFNIREHSYWAIDKKQIQQALAGYFHIAE